MNKNYNEKWYTSTVAILTAFIFFWPLGIVLLYLRLVDKKGKYKTISDILYWVGIGLVIFAVLGMVCCIGEEGYASTFLCALIVFMIPGGVLIYFGNKRKKKMKSYDEYFRYINVRKKISIDSLSEKMGVDCDIVINNITDMINKGMIEGYINEHNYLIVNGYVENTGDVGVETSNDSQKQIKVIKCKECGAKNSVKEGTTVECEYCGTILQG